VRSVWILTVSASGTSESGQTLAAVGADTSTAVETATALRRLIAVSCDRHLVVRVVVVSTRRLERVLSSVRRRPCPLTLGSSEAVQTAAQRRTHALGVRYAASRTERCRQTPAELF